MFEVAAGRVAWMLSSTGLRYALETHPHRWATTAQSLLRLLDHVDSPVLGVNLDPAI